MREKTTSANAVSVTTVRDKGVARVSELVLTTKEIDLMKFIGTKEVAALMGCSIPVARQIMRRKDFPLVKCGKNLKVMASKFMEWASTRRI